MSLAHHGVLFLDELPAFRRDPLETLRPPLEDGIVTLARAAVTFAYPTRFTMETTTLCAKPGSEGTLQPSRFPPCSCCTQPHRTEVRRR